MTMGYFTACVPSYAKGETCVTCEANAKYINAALKTAIINKLLYTNTINHKKYAVRQM